MAGAANFLRRAADGQIIADNTDGKGLVTDITGGAGWSLKDARILIVGAGGAVKGVIPALLEAGPAEIFIVNRTPERAALWHQTGPAGTPAFGAAASMQRIRGRGIW